MSEVILLGAGASVREGIEKGLWDKIKDKEIWSLNSVFKVMPYLPTVQLWVDVGFFKKEANNLRDLQLKGVKLFTREQHTWSLVSKYMTLFQTTREITNFEADLKKGKKTIFYGRMGLVGFFAVSLAKQLGYDKIYLLGYDFGAVSLDTKVTHWYQDKISQKKIYSMGAGRPEVYLDRKGNPNEFLDDWKVFRDDKNIYNVSTNSHLEVFPKITYETFFDSLE